jgi:hypothetical protein
MCSGICVKDKGLWNKGNNRHSNNNNIDRPVGQESACILGPHKDELLR